VLCLSPLCREPSLYQDPIIPWKEAKIFHGGKYRRVRYKEVSRYSGNVEVAAVFCGFLSWRPHPIARRKPADAITGSKSKPNPSSKARQQTSSAIHRWFKPLRPEAGYIVVEGAFRTLRRAKGAVVYDEWQGRISEPAAVSQPPSRDTEKT
jgi:hypothetical protein